MFQNRTRRPLNLDFTSGVSEVLGGLANRVLAKLPVREVHACVTYCTLVDCNTSWCDPSYPNEFSCYDRCTGVRQDFCFAGSCNNFCLSNGC